MMSEPRKGRHFGTASGAEAKRAVSAHPRCSATVDSARGTEAPADGRVAASRKATAPHPVATRRAMPRSSADPKSAPSLTSAAHKPASQTLAQRSASPYARGAYQGTGFVGQDRRPQAPRSQRRRVLSSALIVIGVVLLLVAGGLFAFTQWSYHKQDEVNAQLAAYATVSDAQASGEPEPPQVDWSGLKAVNSDVVGWVQIPGTNVNFPVYQGATNETYLRTSATGEYSIGGQVFLDGDNTAPGMVDNQTLVYGHHLNNGAMFAQVDDMGSQEAFDAAPLVWYVTEDATYKLTPLLFYRTPASNTDARRMNFDTADEFHAYLRGLLGEAAAQAADADAMIDSADRVLTLATCDYDNNFGKGNGRGLLVCVPVAE